MVWATFGGRACCAIHLLIAAALCTAGTAFSQGYPNHTVRIVAPIAAGGATDVLARVLAQKLYESWGQIVQVDNRPGAGGTIGSEIVAHAVPDGYTLLMAYTSHVTNPTLIAKLPYDTLRDFAPVTMVAVSPSVLLTHPSLPVRSVTELIAFAKKHPADLDYGTAGNGTAAHLAGLLFASRAGIVLQHVPYRGGALALYDLLGGQISLMFGNTTSAVPQIRSGKLRALAVTSLRRVRALRDVATVSEAGLPGFEASAWFALLAPAKTPGAVVNKLNSEVVAVLQQREVRSRLDGLGAAGDCQARARAAARTGERRHRPAGRPVRGAHITERRSAVPGCERQGAGSLARGCAAAAV